MTLSLYQFSCMQQNVGPSVEEHRILSAEFAEMEWLRKLAGRRRKLNTDRNSDMEDRKIQAIYITACTI